MQMVKKTAGYLLSVFLLVLVLMPREGLYYKFEQELSKNGIVIGNETISDGWFTLRIENASVYVRGINVATIGEAEVFTLFFYTNVSLHNVKLDESLQSFFPGQIDQADLSYAILHPFKAKISMLGDFGEAWGSIDFKTRKLQVNMSEIDKLGSIKQQFKKVEEGWQYETSF